MTGNTTTMTTGSTYNNGMQDHTQSWITIDTLPIGTHSTGDSFTVSGRTSFPAGFEMDFGAYQTQFLPGSPDLLPPTYSGSTLVTQGDTGENTWLFFVNTTQFRKTLKNGTIIQSDAVAGEYTLAIGPSGMVRYPFTLVEKNVTYAVVPVTNNSDLPVNPSIPPRTTSAPITVVIPFIALVIVVSLLLLKQE